MHTAATKVEEAVVWQRHGTMQQPASADRLPWIPTLASNGLPLFGAHGNFLLRHCELLLMQRCQLWARLRLQP